VLDFMAKFTSSRPEDSRAARKRKQLGAICLG
jgi:hypothetical protein